MENEFQKCNKEHPDCGSVIDSDNLVESTIVIAHPDVVAAGQVVVKVPVLLAENTIQIDVESKIELPEPALEIKRIRKNIFLTQCKLLPKAGMPAVVPGVKAKCSGKLFISGYIRKNIEYATASCVGKSAISGTILHTTVNVPFCTAVPITYLTPVIAVPNSNTIEIETFNPETEGKNLAEQDFESIERFNEKVFCELVSAKFDEADIQVNGNPVGASFPLETTFKTFTEKLVVHLTFKLLQLQQVKIASIG